MDRNYPSFEAAFSLRQKDVHFVFRCRENFCAEVKAFCNSGKKEAIVELRPAAGKPLKDKPYTAADRIAVRLIRIPLSSGKVEILITSLLDYTEYPYEDFKWLYGQRWKIETFYDRFKNLIAVERFSGTSAQFILQEFYCAVYLANMQTVLTWDAQKEVPTKYKDRQYEYKIDSSLSLGFIRKKLLDIFAQDEKATELLEELKQLFIRNISAVRPGRKFDRDHEKYRTRTTPKQFTNRRIIP